MKLIRYIASALAIFIALGVGYEMKPLPTPIRTIAIYDNRQLSGSPYTEPLSTLTLHRIGIDLCTAKDNTHTDPNTYYTPC